MFQWDGYVQQWEYNAKTEDVCNIDQIMKPLEEEYPGNNLIRRSQRIRERERKERIQQIVQRRLNS